MQIRFMAVCVVAALLGACSDSPEAPVVEKTTSYEIPAAVRNTTFGTFHPAAVSSGPRVEIYSNGILKQVFSGDEGGSTAPTDVTLPDNFGEALEQLARNPINKRSAHFAGLLQAVARTPAANRGKAVQAVSKQLLRETEHKDTTLADGTRILEYYFDHQLATRVVLAPHPSVSGRPRTAFSGPIVTPIGKATEVPGETCTESCTAYEEDYDPVVDAELWATVTWIADQNQAMVDLSQVEGDENGLYLVVFGKICLMQISDWTVSVSLLVFGIDNVVSNWGKLTLIQKQLGTAGAAGGLLHVINAWNNMHNCFHP